jgi:hypothetical protein
MEWFVTTLPCDVCIPNTSGKSYSFGIFASNGVVEPGPGVAPGTVGGGKRDIQGMGRLLELQAAKEAELDEFGLGRIVGRKKKPIKPRMDIPVRPAEATDKNVHPTWEFPAAGR